MTTTALIIAVSLSLVPTPGDQATPSTQPAQSGTAVAAHDPFPADQKGIDALATTLTTQWFAHIVSADEASLTKDMQANAQVIDFSGATDRSGAIARIKGLGTSAPKVSDVIASRVGDALVVTCLVTAAQSDGGTALSTEPAPRLGVWQFVGGSWQLAAWASLSAPATRPAPHAPSFAGDATLNATGQELLAKFLTAQHTKDLGTFDGMLAQGMQVVNFKGQKARDDIMQGAKRASTGAPAIADARATQCGDLTVITCNLSMAQSIGFTKLPAAPAPFLAVFQGGKVIALANTNRPE